MPAINFELSNYSQLLMLLAAITYSVALFFYLWDLINSPKMASQPEKAATKTLVTAGAPAAMAKDTQTETSTEKGQTGQTDDQRAVGSSGSSGPIYADDSLSYRSDSSAKRPAARVAVALTVIAVLLHGAGVALRGVATNRVPWGNMYEFCTTGSFLVAAVFLLALLWRDLRFLGTFVIALVLVMLFAAASAFYAPAGHLIPALQSYWLVIHVSIAVLSSALFTLSFALSILQLLQTRRAKKIASGEKDPMPFMRLVPSATVLDNLVYRINAIAFIGWTLTLIFGALWAEKAWGRYWGWDTKEVWTFVIWVVYAGYLHARATRGWSGTRAAWISIVGYLCVVFNFTVVNIYFVGLHSYSGVG